MNTLTTEYRNLTPYKTPSDYGGATWYGWFAVVGQSRDSSALERSNYRRVFEDLKKLDTELQAGDIDPRDESSEGDSTVTDTRCGHWAVGWVETVYVHSSNLAACRLADDILSGLENYTVYDESDFSELESEEESDSFYNWYRSEFITAVSKQLQDPEQEHVPDYGHAGPHVEGCQCEECTDEQLELLTNDDVSELFRRACDATNTYWEHSSDGASIDTERVAKCVIWSDIEHLINAHASFGR